ncbi:major capsid protein [Chrysochromulina parva virophage Moe]|nr:major capsid protein [Chrysochromulina parva virophage Moe]
MQRLQGVSTSHFKVYPQNTGSQTANKIIRFELPSNSLINLRSIRILFNAKAESAGAGTSRLPNDTRSFIDRMAIYMGGVLVQNSFSNYNVLVHAQKALGADRCSDTTLTHQEIVRIKSYHDGSTLTTKEEYSTSDVQLAITDFLGFLGSADPSIIDSGIFPQITLEITLADNVICPSITTPGGGASLGLATTSKTGGICETSTAGSSYTLDNMTLQLEVLGMASSILDEVVAQRISQVGYLSIPFKNYFSFSSTHNNTSRFNINSASWSKLWVCWRDPANSSAAAPQVVAGHKIAGAFTSPVTETQAAAPGSLAGVIGFDLNVDIGKPQYDLGGTYNTNSERYVSRYFNFEEVNASPTTTPTTFQLQINSANYPAYKLTIPEVYTLTMNSIDIYDKSRMMTLDQYRKNFFVQCYRFDLPESSYSRVASGLDTRASSAQCALVTENITASTPCFMFCECDSELRVANRAIELIN